MNSLLKMSGDIWRVGFAALLACLFVTSGGATTNMSAHAAEKDKKTSITNSDFQLTLSNKVYNGDPQDKFLRQSCEPGQHAKVSVKASAKASSRKTKISSKRPATK